MQDANKCPVEVLASVFRTFLRKSAEDLKYARYYQTSIKAVVERGEHISAASTVQVEGHAIELLEFMCNCTAGHSGMQDYVEQQMGHEEDFDIITEVVYFLSQLERDVKRTLYYIQNGDAALNLEPAKDSDSVTERRRLQEYKAARKEYWSSIQTQAKVALQFLTNMATGPHPRNQEVLIHTDILSVVNRFLAYTGYETLHDVCTPVSAANRSESQMKSAGYIFQRGNSSRPDQWWDYSTPTPKRTLNLLISKLLLALLEGSPTKTAVRSMTYTIDWAHFTKHLETLMRMIRVDRNCVSKDAKNSRGRNNDTFLPEVFLEDTNPDKPVVRKWLAEESFQFYTVVEKARIFGWQLEQNSHPSDTGVLNRMHTFLERPWIRRFLQDRIGHIEVVRQNKLGKRCQPSCAIHRRHTKRQPDTLCACCSAAATCHVSDTALTVVQSVCFSTCRGSTLIRTSAKSRR